MYKCLICNKELSSKRNLEIHEYNRCKYSKKCDKCHKILFSRKHLEKHMDSCVGELKCIRCDKILSRKQTYLNHIKKNKCKNKYIIICIN
jgi:DNA-directed RNA polymerase subunit RPC12/RpoP